MSAITHKAALFGIVETVSGTDEFGGAATDTRAILARDIDIKVDPAVLERQFQSTSNSPHKALLGSSLYALSFQTELKWNGNIAGDDTDPWETEPCWRAAGCVAAYTAETGLGVGDGYVDVHPTSASWETATLYCYVDGLLVPFVGTTLTAEIIIEAGGLAVVNWSGFARYTRPTDEAMVVPVYDSQVGLPGRGATFTLGGNAIGASKLQFQLANEIGRRQSVADAWGIPGFHVTKRQPIGSFDPETRLQAVSPAYWTLFDASTSSALSLALGSAGNSATLTMPAMTLDSNAFGDRDGLRVYEIPFHANRSAGDDEWNLHFI